MTLGRALAHHAVVRLVASPALRCVQTLQPLAAVTGLSIETWVDLARSAVDGDGRRLLAKGSAWVMTVGPDGVPTSFLHLPPAI